MLDLFPFDPYDVFLWSSKISSRKDVPISGGASERRPWSVMNFIMESRRCSLLIFRKSMLPLCCKLDKNA